MLRILGAVVRSYAKRRYNRPDRCDSVWRKLLADCRPAVLLLVGFFLPEPLLAQYDEGSYRVPPTRQGGENAYRQPMQPWTLPPAPQDAWLDEERMAEELSAEGWQLPPEGSQVPEDNPRPKRRGGGGGPMGGSGGPGYGAMWFLPQNVKGQGVDFEIVQQNASAAFPVWKGERGIALLTASVSNSHVFTDALLPDTGRAFPSDLWDIGMGVTFFHEFDGGSKLALIASYGSSSDKPFHSIDEMNVSLVSFLRKPTKNGRDAWVIGAMYSPSGSLNFPIPILAYEWNPSEQFDMNIGLPLSINWRPRENWTLSANYLPLTNGNVTLTYDLSERLHLYGGYRSTSEAYFLADRVGKTDRFFALDQRAQLGVRWEIGKNGVLDFSGGYIFDRRYGEGENQGGTWHDEVNVEPGAFVGLNYSLMF